MGDERLPMGGGVGSTLALGELLARLQGLLQGHVEPIFLLVLVSMRTVDILLLHGRCGEAMGQMRPAVLVELGGSWRVVSWRHRVSIYFRRWIWRWIGAINAKASSLALFRRRCTSLIRLAVRHWFLALAV